MEIIFNSEADGGIELKEILGFVDADLTFENLITDIELQTPYLIEYIGKEVYEFALYHYDENLAPLGYDFPELTEAQEKQVERIIKLIQTHIVLMANLQHEQSSDLLHTNAGRKVNRTEDQATPWEWQINRDNAAQMKKAYQALDHLMQVLDESQLEVWTTSEAYKKAHSLFIYRTSIFDNVYSIKNSGQLYYRLVPIMDTMEIRHIFPILGEIKYQSLKAAIKSEQSITDLNDIRLIRLIRDAIAHLTLAVAYEQFPVEMFPDKINYQENTTMKSKARAEVMIKLEKRGEQFLLDVQNHYAKMTAISVERDPTYGLDPENKHVSL